MNEIAVRLKPKHNPESRKKHWKQMSCRNTSYRTKPPIEFGVWEFQSYLEPSCKHTRQELCAKRLDFSRGGSKLSQVWSTGPCNDVPFTWNHLLPKDWIFSRAVHSFVSPCNRVPLTWALLKPKLVFGLVNKLKLKLVFSLLTIFWHL